MSTNPMLNIAIKAARAAGAIINRASLDLGSVQAREKAPNNFVTDVDHAAEQAVIEILLTAYPDHGILAEESGNTHGQEGADCLWIIDPLDGTHNFMHGFPMYCVSIALAVRGKIEVGVIYDSTRNDLFVATKGGGAFLNDKRLRVSKQVDLGHASISTGFPTSRSRNHEKLFLALSDVMRFSGNLRRTGSAALDLAYVAAGYTDGFYEFGLHPWDVAAGSLLVTEAGGLVGNLTGDANFLYQAEIVAAPAKIYAQLVSLLQDYSIFSSDDTKKIVAHRLRDFLQFNKTN